MEIQYETPIRPVMAMPSQYAEKLPATRPERMPSEGPPLLEEMTTSRVCRALVDVNTLTSSGMSAPASVPQDTISESFHQRPSPRPPISASEVRNVVTMHTVDVIHTREVRGRSKSISVALA